MAATPERHPRDPVAAYLRTLAPAGRVTVANRLAAVARELDAAPEDVPWHLCWPFTSSGMVFQHAESMIARISPWIK